MSQLGLNRQLNQFKRNKRALMDDLAKNSLDFFQDTNFKNQAFTDVPRKRWKKLKKPRPDGSTRPILIRTGRLRRSGKKRTLSRSRSQVRFTAPYASYHNEGTRKLPRRQFSGESRLLNRQNKKILVNYTSKIFR